MLSGMAKGYTVEEAGPALPRLLSEALTHPVTITRDNLAVGYLFTPETLEMWWETREILANPEAMKAIDEARAGKGVYYSLDEVDRLLGDED